MGTHNCSTNAICVDLPEGFLCRCKANFVDLSPNPQHFGGTNCVALIDECSTGKHNCHRDAICIDTREAFTCQCKEGFTDADQLQNPGRNCNKRTPRIFLATSLLQKTRNAPGEITTVTRTPAASKEGQMTMTASAMSDLWTNRTT